MNTLGVLGYGALATVDDRGALTTGDLQLDWLVGAHDHWRVPAEDSSTRRRRLGAAPVYETTVRVPRGEVAHLAYGVATARGAAVAVDVENRSPVPLTVGLVARFGGKGRIEVDGPVVRVDGAAALVLSGAPRRWAAGGSPLAVVMAGEARSEPVEPLRAPIELALLFPVPHRTSVRAALGDVADVNARDLPAGDAVARGWEAQLDRGLRAELPAPVGDAVDSARADLLLTPPDAAVVAALEDWGFDFEAAAGWHHLGGRQRRHARRRAVLADPWAVARATDAAADPASFLSALRAVLVHERGECIDVLPGFPTDWLGQSLTVGPVPLRSGRLSYAVRWHGARPALLWDAPANVELRAPALDPAWSTRDRTGEALLAEPPAALLPLGAGDQPRGSSVEAPGQFS